MWGENLPALCYFRLKGKRNDEVWSHKEERQGSVALLNWSTYSVGSLFFAHNQYLMEIEGVFFYQLSTGLTDFLIHDCLFGPHFFLVLNLWAANATIYEPLFLSLHAFHYSKNVDHRRMEKCLSTEFKNIAYQNGIKRINTIYFGGGNFSFNPSMNLFIIFLFLTIEILMGT